MAGRKEVIIQGDHVEECGRFIVEKFKVKKVTPSSENIKEEKDYRKRKVWEGIHKVRSYKDGFMRSNLQFTFTF